MEHPEEHYYKLLRFLLSMNGLCPYQSKKNAYLIRIALTIIALSSAFVQVSGYLLEILTRASIPMEFIIDGMPTLLITMGTLISLYMRIIHVDKFRELFDRISKDWALQKTSKEIKIMHKHAENSKLFAIYYIILVYILATGYNIWLFVPNILDVMLPMNESRKRRQPFKAEFFIDEERHFYLIQFHMCFVIFTLPLIYVTCSILFVTFTEHVCGMCELLGYRAERFYAVENKAAYNLIQGSQLSFGNMVVFVRQHYNVIKFVDLIETCHTLPFLMDLVGIMVMMSLTLIQVSTISNGEQALRSISVSIVSLYYIFISSYMGQKVMDTSSNICEKVFNSTWYNAVVSEQKALLMILMRCYHPLILTACKFYMLSLQSFGMILQTTISYCMFIRQV